MSNILVTLLGKFNGWKTVIAFLLANIPLFTANPLLVEAINKVIANPKDIQAWIDLVIQILLLLGIGDIIRKNLTFGVARVGQK